MHVPTDRPLTDPELEAVIAHVLLGTTSAGTLQLSFLSDADQAANQLGLTDKAKDMFLRHNREGYVREFNGLVNRLISLGLLVTDWSLDRHDVYRVTERGRDALQNRTKMRLFAQARAGSSSARLKRNKSPFTGFTRGSWGSSAIRHTIGFSPTCPLKEPARWSGS